MGNDGMESQNVFNLTPKMLEEYDKRRKEETTETAEKIVEKIKESSHIKPKEGLPPHQYGWCCPRCGNVYAPYVSGCGRCNVQEMTWTC